jgi:hypothetical protein
VKKGAMLNNVLHQKLPCVLGKMLGRSLDSEDWPGGRVRQWPSGGGRGSSDSGDRAAWLDQQATQRGLVVHKEELRGLWE